ncbi:MAG: hypothetical protein JST18_14015 [Bacteroidetes bacterium]|nr:hypothetical protein [Bacteroidota bacterium]
MKQPTGKEVYTTIIILALASLGLNYVFHLRYADYAAAVLLLIALFVYPVAVWITIGWLKFAQLLGTINSKILLTLIFFIFLFPIATLYRLSKKDPLQRKKLNKEGTSYFSSRNHTYQPDDFKHTF